MPTRKPRVTLIGAGKVGTVLGAALHAEGYRIVTVISRHAEKAVRTARTLECPKASTNIADISAKSELILMAVPDSVLPSVAESLSKRRKLAFDSILAVHTSGVVSSAVLDPLRLKGASSGSIHPIMTFPEQRPLHHSVAQLKHIFFGIEGEPSTLPALAELVGNLGSRSIVIPAEMKPLYHTLCVFASGYLMVFLNAISELSGTLRLGDRWTEVFGPLMTASMENSIKLSAPEALTGPILREDLPTLQLHLSALRQSAPHLISLYTVAGIEFARIARNHSKITESNYQNVLSLFKKFIGSMS